MMSLSDGLKKYVDNERYRNLLLFLFSLGLFLFLYHLLYGGFFPSKNGRMGHDWNLAGLLIQAGQYKEYGLELWRTYATPIGCNISAVSEPGFPLAISSLLVFLNLSPLSAAYGDFLGFAALAFVGAYVLSRGLFKTSFSFALLCSFLFSLNEFYADRMIIGHAYKAIMLVPLIAYFLSVPVVEKKGVLISNTYAVFGGFLAAFAWFNGVMPIVVPVVLSLILLFLLAIIVNATSLKIVLSRSVVAIAVAVGLSWWSLSQLINSASFVSSISLRETYSLQGFNSVWNTLKFIFLMVFVGPSNIAEAYSRDIVNLMVFQGRHELDFSIGMGCLILLLGGGGFRLYAWFLDTALVNKEWWKEKGVWVLLIAVFLFFPVVYTTYSSVTNVFFKQIPLLNSTTSPQRIFVVYVVFFVFFAVVLADKVIVFPRVRIAAAIFVAAITLLQTVSKDRSYYHDQPYDPSYVEAVFLKLASGGDLPAITNIGLLKDGNGNPVSNQSVESNLFAQGVQPMGCYVPGYSSAPTALIKSLHPGPVNSVNGGVFNIKNPACNTWPRENGCTPGDHFRLEQSSWVDLYVHHKRYPINISPSAKLARWVSLSFFVMCVFSLLAFLFKKIKLARWNDA